MSDEGTSLGDMKDKCQRVSKGKKRQKELEPSRKPTQCYARTLGLCQVRHLRGGVYVI
jgi:hypothetical protein